MIVRRREIDLAKKDVPTSLGRGRSVTAIAVGKIPVNAAELRSTDPAVMTDPAVTTDPSVTTDLGVQSPARSMIEPATCRGGKPGQQTTNSQSEPAKPIDLTSDPMAMNGAADALARPVPTSVRI